MCVFCFRSDSGVHGDHLQDKKRQTIIEVTQRARQEKSNIHQFASDTQHSIDAVAPDTQCSIVVRRLNDSDRSSNLSSPDRVKLFDYDEELAARSTATDWPMNSSNDVGLCCSCRAIEQQSTVRTVRPRSLEVTNDIKVNVEGQQYENLQRVFRDSSRGAGGSGADVSEGRNNEDVEEMASKSSSSGSVSVSVTTPVGRVISSVSVDTAIDRAMSVIKCNDVDLISNQFTHNSVELDSTRNNSSGVPNVSAERYFCKNNGAKIISNQTTHCSRPPGEILLLNRDLLKHSSRKPRSVSAPIDIVSAQPLSPDQKIYNSLALDVNAATSCQSQDMQQICSGSSISPDEDSKAMRKRAYRVGLNIFNR